MRQKAYFADRRIGPLTLPSPLSTGERVLIAIPRKASVHHCRLAI